MSDPELSEGFRNELRAAWHRYVDLTAPLRPLLHGYCRRLTGSLWDAEDLVQETLLRGFGTLGSVHEEIRNPRAYLLRIASNLWIDTVRRRSVEADALAARPAPATAGAPAGELRDAGAALLQRLAPQERAAVLLKDVFELSLEEIAEVLATTTGAVKSALHRGRGRLQEPVGSEAPPRPAPSEALLDRFVAAYRAADVGGLVALMLENGSVENVGCSFSYGAEALDRNRKEGWFHHAVHGHPEWPPEFQYESARLERAEVGGEPVLLGFATRRGREALEQVLRIEEQDGRIRRLRGYAFCPETMREVGAALGLHVRTGLYRYPTAEPGVSFR